MKKVLYVFILSLITTCLIKGQAYQCEFIAEFKDFNFQVQSVGDTTYSILSDKKMVKCFVLSCRGDCYAQEINRKTGKIYAEGYYSVIDDKVDTVETKIFDPDDPSKHETRIDYITYPIKTGLWIYNNDTIEKKGRKKIIFIEGSKVLEMIEK